VRLPHFSINPAPLLLHLKLPIGAHFLQGFDRPTANGLPSNARGHPQARCESQFRQTSRRKVRRDPEPRMAVLFKAACPCWRTAEGSSSSLPICKRLRE
jgi:hypothetical protein